MTDTVGTTGDDRLNGGSGNDTLLGLEGDDRLNAGSGNDIVDGGSGSDIVRGDSGEDILVYRASENIGSTDIYDGGSGIDTLRLILTLAEWMNPQVQQDIASYLAFIASHTLASGQADNREFRFTAFDLRISTVEKLEVYVDGVQIDPRDQTVIAVNDAITTNEDTASLSVNLLGNDAVPDLVQSVIILQGPTLGSISLTTDFSDVANPLALAVYTPSAALQSLAVGETATDTFTYQVTDADGDTSTATVTVTITGTNDAPVITAEAGDSAGATLVETDAGLNASGTLTASDVDVSDIVTASVVGVTHVGPTGGLSDADLLSYFHVTSGPLDTSSTTSGQLTWTFNSGTQAFDFLAVGETLTLHYTIRPDDGHGPSFVGDGVVTIHITGTNDAPEITGGATTGVVQEDGTLSATGTLTANDIDNGAIVSWSVTGGVDVIPSSFSIGVDQLRITKTGNVVFEDNFSDGIPPPSVTNDAGLPFANSYAVGGTILEVGGRAVLDYANGGASDAFGTPDPGVFSGATLLSNVNPSDPVNGLKLATDFEVEARFDLSIPDDNREFYGIRLADRTIGGPGTPPDQLGDDVVDLLVRRDASGVVTVTLREIDFITETATNLQTILLAPPPDADQITLRLTHQANAQTVQAAFDYLSEGVIVGTQTFSTSATIFTNEIWTRAQLVASASQQATSVLDTHYGTPSIDQDGNWTYTLANDRTNVQALAEGQTAIDTFTVQVTDEHGAVATQAVDVAVMGTNDAPVIQSGSPTQPTVRFFTEIADNAPGENITAHSATGLIAFLDVDLTDVHSAIATELGSGYRGVMTASVTRDTTGGHGGYVTWTFTAEDSALDGLAQGQVVVQDYSITVDDGHGGTASRTVRVNITGTNDAPVITSGPGSGFVVENQSGVATGTMHAFDPDNGAQKFWTVLGGTAADEASYQFVMDNFRITRNGNLFFEDTFSDGLSPPNSPNFGDGVTPHTYGLTGAFQEADGKLIIDSSDASTVLSIGTPDPFIGNIATVRSNIDPANLARGLKSDDDFVVEGVFDLIIPDSPRETYGIRLSDRLVGGNGTPPDQLGDDLIELVVRKGQDGLVRVQLRELDIVNDQVTNIQGILLTPPPGADQIRLRLTHSVTDVGALHASFDYLDGGFVVGSATFSQVGRIFGTETPAFAGDDENWTRAQIVTYAPAITDSTLAGAYGTLTIDQSGAWIYNLATGQTNVQNLAQGQTVIDTFTVQVTDEHGASDTETINITVTGTNDAPVIATGPVSHTLAENSAPILTATGDAFFFDIDLADTHTISPSLVSAVLSDASLVPADVLAAAATALSTTILDPATGDSDGQYQWDFALDNGLTQFLTDGQTLSLAYSIAAFDNYGAVDTQIVTINITGADEAPVVTGGTTIVTDFATINLPGALTTYAIDINDIGQIAGHSAVAGHATGWTLDENVFTSITVSGANNTNVNAINDLGVIGGYYEPFSSTPRYGFTLDTAGFHLPISLSPGISTTVDGINNAGVLVGASYLNGGNVYAGFVDDHGSVTILDAPGANYTVATGINDVGQIVGTFTPSYGSNWHGFIYEDGVFTQFDDPLGVNGTFASDINDAGEIVGWFTDGSGINHGYLYSGGVFTTIDNPGAVHTYAAGINDAGQVVGWYTDVSGIDHGYVASIIIADDAGTNVLVGNAANNTFRVSGNAVGESDAVSGGDGSDTLIIDYSGATNSVLTYDLAGIPLGGGTYSDGADHAVGLGSIERVSITTGSGNDQITTGSGNDTLAGGTGNDTLTGGAGSDQFVFKAGWGVDTVADFQDGLDLIDIRTMGASEVAEVAVSQSGADAHIDFGAGDVLILSNFNMALLDNSDFRFS